MWEETMVCPNETNNTQIKAFANSNNHVQTDTHANLINCYIYDQALGQHVVNNMLHYDMPMRNTLIYDEINGIPGVIAKHDKDGESKQFH